MNTVFDLLQKLNISNSNDSSLSLDTFSLLTILFCNIAFSKCKEIHFFQRQQNLLLQCENLIKEKLEI